MENTDMFVEFDRYCETCTHRDLDEKFDPCHECLGNPVNTNSIKPINYEEDEEKVKEKEKENNENEEN